MPPTLFLAGAGAKAWGARREHAPDAVVGVAVLVGAGGAAGDLAAGQAAEAVVAVAMELGIGVAGRAAGVLDRGEVADRVVGGGLHLLQAGGIAGGPGADLAEPEAPGGVE